MFRRYFREGQSCISADHASVFGIFRGIERERFHQLHTLDVVFAAYIYIKDFICQRAYVERYGIFLAFFKSDRGRNDPVIGIFSVDIYRSGRNNIFGCHLVVAKYTLSERSAVYPCQAVIVIVDSHPFEFHGSGILESFFYREFAFGCAGYKFLGLGVRGTVAVFCGDAVRITHQSAHVVLNLSIGYVFGYNHIVRQACHVVACIGGVESASVRTFGRSAPRHCGRHEVIGYFDLGVRYGCRTVEAHVCKCR